MDAATPSSADPTNPFNTPRAVRIANKYVVLEKIGSGAFGDIYSGILACHGPLTSLFRL